VEQIRHLGKVEIRETNNNTDYATNESVVEFLRTIAARDDFPIFDFLSHLSRRKVDSISLSRDSPYRYFFASTSGNNVSIVMKEEKRTVELQLPFNELKNLFLQRVI
jgi:hypothetical protein